MGIYLSEERACSEKIYSAMLHAWVELMYASLEKLILLDSQLNDFQPIHSGRLRIQWFAYKPKEWQFKGERYPLFVQWRRNFAIGLWRSQRIPIASVLRHQHKTKAFKAHAVEVRELLSQMRELILIYRKSRKTLRLLQSPSLQKAQDNIQIFGSPLILSISAPLVQGHQ
jgi:hypothetical protein